MDYTVVGNMSISKLTLGTTQLGLKYGVANSSGRPSYQRSNEILRIAADHGVNCFETAPRYGNSERIIGSFLSSYLHFPDPPIIVTKLPPISLSPKTTPDNAYDLVREQIVKSMKRLQLDRLPIYLLHRASNMESYGGLIIENLVRLKSEGLIGMIGVSIYTPEEVEYALGLGAMDVIQIPISIFDHRLTKTGLLTRLKDNNFIVFARSVFLQGLFFLNVANLPRGLALAEGPLRQLQKLCHDQEISVAELALTFVRDLPGITSLVIGAETPNQILEDTSLMDSPPLPSELRKEIVSIFSNLPIELINPSLWRM